MVDSLSAFWPGLQVLAGDVENAIKAHMICKWAPLSPRVSDRHEIDWNLWKKFAGLPEGEQWYWCDVLLVPTLPCTVWDMNYKMGTSQQYPLRPEFVESTWYLYRVRFSVRPPSGPC